MGDGIILSGVWRWLYFFLPPSIWQRQSCVNHDCLMFLDEKILVSKIDFDSLSLSLPFSLNKYPLFLSSFLCLSHTHSCLYFYLFLFPCYKKVNFLLKSLSHFFPSLLDWNVNQTRKCFVFLRLCRGQNRSVHNTNQ